ncbi:hypothetical protein, partial [Endozoicomonas sp. SESOKO3]
MDRLSQFSCNKRQNSPTFNATENRGKVCGKIVSPVSDKALGVHHANFTQDLVTGQKDQKEIGITSRAVASGLDSHQVAKLKPKLKKLKDIQGANTAIISDRQLKLIKRLMDHSIKGRLTAEKFIDVIDFIYYRPEKILPKDYFKSPTLLSGIIRNQLWDVSKTEIADKIWDVLISTPERKKQLLLTRVREKGVRHYYEDLSDELKNDIDFLTEWSTLKGIPRGTPPNLAVQIYERLDIGAKIKSVSVLPRSFADDDVYNELIRSGRITLNELPQNIRKKNKEYCLSQLSKGLCRLSEVPAQFITEKAILDSLDGRKFLINFFELFNDDIEYDMLISHPEFFEEVLVKITSAPLEIRMPTSYTHIDLLYDVYKYCIKRYRYDRERLALLLKKLIKVNPFFVIPVKNMDDELLQGMIKEGKELLLAMLIIRPEISQCLDTEIISFFFKKVNAGDDFKTHVMNIVYPYFPINDKKCFPEDILQKQDTLVLNSAPFVAGGMHIINRGLRPVKGKIIIDYIEGFQSFLTRFNDKEYLKKCCTDPTTRQKLIHVLAIRFIANKRQCMKEWKHCLPRKLIHDTLAYLNNPALFPELDVSGTLTEPVNPLTFQQPNTSAFKLLVSL